MTLGGLCLLAPVPFVVLFVDDIEDRFGFTGAEGAGLSVNRTRDGEVTGDSTTCDTASQLRVSISSACPVLHGPR